MPIKRPDDIIPIRVPFGDPIVPFVETTGEPVKCYKCLTIYKSKNSEYVYEMDERFKGLCPNCYKKKLNEEFTDDIAEKFARQAISEYENGLVPPGIDFRQDNDVSDANWNNKVKPLIRKILEENKEKELKAKYQHKLDEAIDFVKDAIDLTETDYSGTLFDWNTMPSDPVTYNVMYRIILKLMERIDKLERGSKENLYRS